MSNKTAVILLILVFLVIVCIIGYLIWSAKETRKDHLYESFAKRLGMGLLDFISDNDEALGLLFALSIAAIALICKII